MEQQLSAARDAAAQGAGESKGHLALHTLRNSGHWVHVRFTPRCRGSIPPPFLPPPPPPGEGPFGCLRCMHICTSARWWKLLVKLSTLYALIPRIMPSRPRFA